MTTRPPSLELDAGHLALDFLNTLRATPSDLLAWLEQASPTPAPAFDEVRASPPAARLLFAEARHLRSAVGDLVRAYAREEPPPDHALFALNRVLRADPRTTQVTAGPHGPQMVERSSIEDPAPCSPRHPAPDPLRAMILLAPIALGAARLLSTAEPKRLRTCAAEDCGAWFLDTSKGGRRRWCSMARCGNRAKAARHRRRGAAVTRGSRPRM